MAVEPAPECLARSIFTVGEESFDLQKVLGAAEHLGQANALWSSLADSLACATFAVEEGFGEEPEQVQDAVDGFRYGRGLVSAEETERWLAERGLSVEDLYDTLARARWLRNFQGQLAEIRAGYAPRPGALGEALWPELIVHGHLGCMARCLARLVVAPRLVPAASGLEGGAAAVPPAPRGCPAWACCPPAWRARLRRLESVYTAVCGSLLAPRRLEQELASRRLDLTRFGLLLARSASRDAARELLLCVTQDGEPFEQAAVRAGAGPERTLLFLEDAPESMAPHLVSAVPGECALLEDAEQEEQEPPVVMYVAEKIPPRLDDPDVRARLEAALLERSFAPVIDEHVRWLCPLE
jgi:hypothetical protein